VATHITAAPLSVATHRQLLRHREWRCKKGLVM
jgi:hypothetical protein